MDIKFNFDADVAVITINGTLNASNAENLKSKFLANISKSKYYIMDLESMDFVDSTGLGAIVACLKYSVENGGMVKIANLQSKPKMLFEITRVYRIFDIFDSLKSAQDSF